MCGLVGIFNYKNKKKVSKNWLVKMAKQIAHRGPDEFGVYLKKNIGLGFQRLSIIDINNGSQPMTSNSRKFTIVFNGEIYNHNVLRQALAKEGYSFKTNSDTEVILALFEMGYPYPERLLDGMFAFAIYNRETNNLILSRDQTGKKPLFYRESENGIEFVSEIKAFCLHFKKALKGNNQAISDFLTLGYLPQPTTAFQKIKQVKGGSRICISKSITETSWRKAPLQTRNSQKYRDILKETEELISCSVRKRMTADVPIGLFLSGGLDSSVILSMVMKHGIPENFSTFTVDFKNKNFSESQSAKTVSKYFGVPNYSFCMEPSDFINVFDETVWSADNLLANPATFAYTFLSKHAVRKNKVALHGGGSDELFFGYDTYYANKIARIFDIFPAKMFSPLTKVFNKLPASHQKLALDYKLKKFFQSIHLKPLERHYNWRTIFTEEEKKLFLLNFENKKSSFWAYKEAFEKNMTLNFDEIVSRADFDVWWCSMGNYQADISSMANGLELRLPFMDNSLRDYLYSIPTASKFSLFNRKKLLKDIGKSVLPPEILRLPKSGFHLPFAEWFRGPLYTFVRDHLNDLSKAPFIKNEGAYFDSIVSDHKHRKEDNSFKIINLLVLSKWLKLYL